MEIYAEFRRLCERSLVICVPANTLALFLNTKTFCRIHI